LAGLSASPEDRQIVGSEKGKGAWKGGEGQKSPMKKENAGKEVARKKEKGKRVFSKGRAWKKKETNEKKFSAFLGDPGARVKKGGGL